MLCFLFKNHRKKCGLRTILYWQEFSKISYFSLFFRKKWRFPENTLDRSVQIRVQKWLLAYFHLTAASKMVQIDTNCVRLLTNIDKIVKNTRNMGQWNSSLTRKSDRLSINEWMCLVTFPQLDHSDVVNASEQCKFGCFPVLSQMRSALLEQI